MKNDFRVEGDVAILSIEHKGEAVEVLVDVADLPLVAMYQWYVNRWNGKLLARAMLRDDGGKQEVIFLHRYLVGEPDELRVRHKNGNRLDNRRENLQVASLTELRATNGLMSTNRSGYKGVTRVRGLDKDRPKWKAAITVEGRKMALGTFEKPEDAAWAYDVAALKHFGEFANLNFPLAKDQHPADESVPC